MELLKGKNINEFIAKNMKNETIGKGYIYQSLASKLFDKDRVNYFIDSSTIDESDTTTREKIVYGLIEIAQEMKRNNYPNLDGRVYHCCFSTDEKSREFYSTINGFKHDEGMLILEHSLENITETKIEYDCIEDNLETDEEIIDFINEHTKIFLRGPYNLEKIKELKKDNNLKSFGIYDGNNIIANMLLIFDEEDGEKIGWIEDMFVSSNYRKEGLAKHLLEKGLHYFKKTEQVKSRLEVWSNNKRAVNLYNQLGYYLHLETEISIGMKI